MNVIINKDKFKTKNIKITQKMKLIYSYENIQMLGIALIINDFDFMIKNNYIILKLLNKKDIKFFEEIDNYFSEKYENYKKSLLENKIYIKNILNKNVEKELYINVNSLKQKDFIFYLNIFTL